MKRFLLSLCIVVAGVVCGLQMGNMKIVNGETGEGDMCITSTFSVEDSMEIAGDISINLDSGLDAIVIKNGGILKISNSTLSSSNDVTLGNVFVVESGGELILENVKMDTSIIAECGILNHGYITLNGVTIPKEISVSVCQDSSMEHSFKLISAELTKGVELDNGYISILENTEIKNKLKILDWSCKENTIIAKGMGENVFASKFIDKLEISNLGTKQHLDYIGDGVSSDGFSQGDIIVATHQDISKVKEGSTIKIPNSYCTGWWYYNQTSISKYGYFIQKYPTDGDSEIIYIDNYNSCNTGNYLVGRKDSDEGYGKASVTVVVTMNGESISTNSVTYPCGPDWAVFVDIPDGASIDSMTSNISNSNFSLKDNLHANSRYFRPVIEFDGDATNDASCVVTFNFADPKEEAVIILQKSKNVTVSMPENIYVDESYQIEITTGEDTVVDNITFNGDSLELEKKEDKYIITVTMTKTNTLEISSHTNILVTPKTFSFGFGDKIELKQSIYVESMDENVDIYFIAEEDTNVGTHRITGVMCKEQGYVVTLQDGDWTYTINPKIVDLTNVIYKESVSKEYSEDFQLHQGIFVESMPEYMSCTATYQSGSIDIGSQKILLTFGILEDNYSFGENISQLEVILDISPKELSIGDIQISSLEHTYTGTPKEAVITGIPEEYAYASIQYLKETQEIIPIDAGEYLVHVDIFPKTKFYTCTKTIEDTMLISPASVEMKGITFEDISTTYDGNNHIPVVTGNIPAYITCNISQNTCINVGTYVVECSFCSLNPNYLAPESMSATVEITPREIQVQFLDPINLLETGERKEIGLTFTNVLPEEEIYYNISYSGNCIFAGTYTCQVTLKDSSNYKLVGITSHTFTILSTSSEYITPDINIVLEGKFLPNGESIVDTSTSLEVASVVAEMDIRSYASFLIDYIGETEETLVKLQAHNMQNYEDISLYTIENGELTKLDYTLKDNTIIFTITKPVQLILVEHNPHKTTAPISLLIVSISLALILAGTTCFLLRKKHKRKCVEHFINVE